MTNQQVVQAFLDNKAGHSLNMRTNGEKLWSYDTVIAQIDGNIITINMTKYSPTTSKQRNYLVRALNPSEYVTVDGLKMGVQSL